MTCRLVQAPSLVEMLMVCQRIPADEQEQYEAFRGEAYDFEVAASTWFALPGPKWTILAGDDRPLLVAGFLEIRSGVWQDWMFSTPAAWEPPNWRSVTRMSKGVMDAMLQGPAHRLQCVSLASRIQAHKWYRPLGLRLEGTLHGYGAQGEDALMFSRVRSP